MHWTGRDACAWLRQQRTAGPGSSASSWPRRRSGWATCPAARQRTIAVLGHEQAGIPPEAVDLLDVAVEIPR